MPAPITASALTGEGAFDSTLKNAINTILTNLNANWASLAAGTMPLAAITYQPPIALTTNGAIAPSTAAVYNITKAGVLADTLAAPVAGTDDGKVIMIFSTTANAHTVTATGLFLTGTASVNLATFANSAGAGFVIMANNAKWVVISSVGITFS